VTDFGTEIRASMAGTRERLAAARLDGDDYLIELLLGELESLTRIAADHHVVLDTSEALGAGEPAA
jgi:hypothetical protein